MDNRRMKAINASLEKEADQILFKTNKITYLIAILVAAGLSFDVTMKLSSEHPQMTFWEGFATFFVSWIIVTLMVTIVLMVAQVMYHMVCAFIIGMRNPKQSSETNAVQQGKLDEQSKTGELLYGVFYSNRIDVEKFNEFLEGNKDFLSFGENLCLLYFVLLDKECIKKNNSAFREYVGARIECVRISTFNSIYNNVCEKIKGDSQEDAMLEKSENMLLKIQPVIKGK